MAWVRVRVSVVLGLLLALGLVLGLVTLHSPTGATRELTSGSRILKLLGPALVSGGMPPPASLFPLFVWEFSSKEQKLPEKPGQEGRRPLGLGVKMRAHASQACPSAPRQPTMSFCVHCP